MTRLAYRWSAKATGIGVVDRNGADAHSASRRQTREASFDGVLQYSLRRQVAATCSPRHAVNSLRRVTASCARCATTWVGHRTYRARPLSLASGGRHHARQGRASRCRLRAAARPAPNRWSAASRPRADRRTTAGTNRSRPGDADRHALPTNGAQHRRLRPVEPAAIVGYVVRQQRGQRRDRTGLPLGTKAVGIGVVDRNAPMRVSSRARRIARRADRVAAAIQRATSSPGRSSVTTHAGRARRLGRSRCAGCTIRARIHQSHRRQPCTADASPLAGGASGLSIGETVNSCDRSRV